MHPKYNNCKYVSILPLQGTNIYSVINNEENMILWNIMHKANEGELVHNKSQSCQFVFDWSQLQ